MNDTPVLPTFIRKEWTRFAMREIARVNNHNFVLDLLVTLISQSLLAFLIPPLLIEKYLAGLVGYEALGRRMFYWLKMLKERR